MNISLPDELRDFVEEQVKRGYGTSSEYVRELIRRDQDRLRRLSRVSSLTATLTRPLRTTSASRVMRLRWGSWMLWKGRTGTSVGTPPVARHATLST